MLNKNKLFKMMNICAGIGCVAAGILMGMEISERITKGCEK